MISECGKWEMDPAIVGSELMNQSNGRFNLLRKRILGLSTNSRGRRKEYRNDKKIMK